MKFFIARKKYDLLNKEYLLLNDKYEELKEGYEEIRDVSKDYYLKIRELEDENEKLVLNKINLDNEVTTLNQEVRLYEKTVKELEEEIEKLKKANEELSNLWNDANRKLWCNNESARQLRDLSKDILASQRLDKTHLSRYINDIAFYIGGGVGVELKLKEGEKVNEQNT